MNNDNGSIDLYNIFLFLGLGSLVVAGIVCAYRGNTQRKAQMQTFAQSNGWSYAHKDIDRLSDRLGTYFPHQVSDVARIVTVEDKTRTLRLFDCRKFIFNRKNSGHYATGCIIESPRFRYNGADRDIVAVYDREGFDALWGSDLVDLGARDFAERYVVSTKNKTLAQNLLTPALQTMLLKFRQGASDNIPTVAFTSTGAVALISTVNASPERMLSLIEFCRTIESAMP